MTPAVFIPEISLTQAVLLGLIEGFTEFLPISSTAHLIVAQKLMGLETVNSFFTVVVQLGAILAVIVYFFQKILLLMKESLAYLFSSTQKKSFDTLPTGILILLASLPVLLIGFLIRNQMDSLHNSLSVIAIMSISVGVLLAIAEWYSKRKVSRTTLRANESVEQTPKSKLFLMGLFQILALLPGASRSGTAIAGGLFAGLSFSTALEFSFLLSIPALLVAGGYEVLSAVQTPPTTDVLLMTLIGSVVAFVSALVSIKFLLATVRRLGFIPFVVYRIVFGIAILLL